MFNKKRTKKNCPFCRPKTKTRRRIPKYNEGQRTFLTIAGFFMVVGGIALLVTQHFVRWEYLLPGVFILGGTYIMLYTIFACKRCISEAMYGFPWI